MDRVGACWLGALLSLALLAGGCGGACGEERDATQGNPAKSAEELAAQDREDRLETEGLVRRLEATGDEDRLIELLDELSWVGHSSAIEPLSHYLLDEREQVAVQAAVSLSEIGGPGSIQALGRAFGLPGRTEVKRQAIEALHYVGYEDVDAAVVVLLRALDDEDPEVRSDAAEALLLLDEPGVAATIRDTYEDESQPERVRDLLAGLLPDLEETPTEEAP